MFTIWVEIIAPFVAKPEQLPEILKNNNIKLPVILSGNGASVYKDAIQNLKIGQIPPASAALPGVCDMAVEAIKIFDRDGAADTAAMEPDYIREPDAKKPPAITDSKFKQ